MFGSEMMGAPRLSSRLIALGDNDSVVLGADVGKTTWVVESVALVGFAVSSLRAWRGSTAPLDAAAAEGG